MSFTWAQHIITIKAVSGFRSSTISSLLRLMMGTRTPRRREAAKRLQYIEAGVEWDLKLEYKSKTIILTISCDVQATNLPQISTRRRALCCQRGGQEHLPFYRPLGELQIASFLG